ncbi:hypothetical protein LDENG_00184190, partial [Lucifuga dentata]
MALRQVQEWNGEEERINKETGELSASGDLSICVEVKAERVEGTCGDPQPLHELREQLQQLEIHSAWSSDHSADHATSERLLKVITLYIQVCEHGVRAERLDLTGFAALTAEAVIANIHNKLLERPAEEAREEVVQFFQRQEEKTDHDTEDSPGWLLLKSLSLLTADSLDIWSCIKPDLSAALVKCLYLLVCLPAWQENTTREETFQELLTQVLLQLCRQPVYVERLVETQELQCLIIGLTSFWDQTSASWRNQASRVLRAVSAALTGSTVPTLLGKSCVGICIQNLLLVSEDVSGPSLAEVAVAVFSFIRDTYPFNPALFMEFDSHDGYKALEIILKRCEEGVSEDQFQPVEELLALVASFTMFGNAELKVALCVTNPQPPGFKFDSALTKGSAIKNLPAFHLLQNSFLRSQDSRLCCQILHTLQSIWEWDPANFFLLEWTVQLPAAVHTHFFSLLEMVVFQLNYIPHESLRVVHGVLKQSWSGTVAAGVAGLEFGVAALNSFYRMMVHSSLLVEVLSDWGLLQLLLGELRRRAKILRKAGVVSAPQRDCQQGAHAEDRERLLTTCMLKVVSVLTLRSVKNTVSVRDCGMVPYIKIFLDVDEYRGHTLSVLEQLAEINPEEFMSTAIGALCSSTRQEHALKQDLLQSMLRVLESPNSWDAFRRVGGFTGLLSLVTDMEGALSNPPQAEVWRSMGQERVLNFILLTLHILATAVHLHTVNAYHFQTEGFYERLAEALLQSGCFQTEDSELWKWDENKSPQTAGENKSPRTSFHKFVELAEAPLDASSPQFQRSLPVTLRTCIRLLSYLSQFATGTCSAVELNLRLWNEDKHDLEKETQNFPYDALTSSPECVEDTQQRSRNAASSISTVCSESQYRFTCDQVIFHPGALRVIVTLLPSAFTPEDPQLSMELQLSLADHIQAMVKSERNRQIMCEGGLVSTLLTHCRRILLASNHPLHLPVTRVLEKLSSQAITHSDL